MVSYKWKCNACDKSNSEESTSCVYCGCKAGASVEEVQRHIDFESFEQEKARNLFEKEITKFLFLPFSVLVVVFSGRFEFIALVIGSLFITLKYQKKIIAFIFSDPWLKKVMLIASSSMVGIMLVRIFLISDNSDLVIWISFGLMLLIASTFYLLFKSKKGNESFMRYYKDGS